MRLGIGRSVALVAFALIFAIGFTSSQNVSAVGTLGDEHVHANLEVTIFGDKFDFSSPAFQIKSSWIHFENSDGNTIHRHASGVPLGDLFDSLNIVLTDSCYIFPDGRQFCTNNDYSLKFFVNNAQVFDLRGYVVQEGDNILIIYDSDYFSSITVSTDRSSYQSGDTITITGKTSMTNIYVTMLVSKPNGNIISVSQISPDYSGAFGEEIATTAPTLWDSTGTYTVSVQQGESNMAKTTFYFESVSATSPQITVSTDRTSYHEGDTIRISGNVGEIFLGTPVGLKIFSPRGDLVTIEQLDVSYTGHYQTQLLSGGALWEDPGTYTIKVTYGSTGANFKTAEATFVFGDTPKLLSSNPRIVDDFGNTLHSVSVNQMVHITADLESQNNFEQIFVYYYKIKETGSEAWITGSLAPGQSFSPALSWTPTRAGTYTIDITIFGDIQGQNVLAPTITIRQVVDDSGGGIPTSPNTVFIPSGSSVPGCERTNECFIPDEITINVGDTVKWENKDSAAHTVTSGFAGEGPDGNFDSNMFMPDKTFQVTFDTAGEYPYFDMVHPWMAGVVIVKETSGSGIVDTTPPLLLTPSDMTIDASDSSGARVDYSVKAIDNEDGILRPNCFPSSGSLFPIGETTVTCSATDSSGNSDRKSFLITVNPPDVLIPSWIKDVAGFWCSDEIDNASFIEAIQYLINNDVILVPATVSSGSGSQEIPNWVKSNACWWSQGLITNSDFASGLQYLIGQGIIRV